MSDYTIYGILYSCPAGERNMECPIKSLDHLSFYDKIEWIDGLKMEERQAINQEHWFCSSKRKNKIKDID
ncbi:hypothetical protein [Labilibaculum sp.]|uniref:hypothetical protein n=1 Tax=Labilibaculum sp. TaxID=2060723 RepID=UPI002AA5FCAB|nr:hypothetical protein [Labilibaculum sp.]MBN2597449.1 hypothetical protein [Marinifilaceae bacterium]